MIVIVFAVILGIIGTQCPSCRRWRALRAIGEGSNTIELCQCKYCGHQVWKEIQDDCPEDEFFFTAVAAITLMKL